MKIRWTMVLSLFVAMASLLCMAQKQTDKSVTIVFKDGHQKTFAVSNVSRIEFKNNAMLVSHDGREESIPVADIVRMDFNSGRKALPGRSHFVGKWEFGEGNGDRTFFVTLDANGQAHKTLGASHGTWVVVDGEARISWDDGWHDVIKEVGGKHEKFAYEPGKPLTGDPSNVANAKSLNSEPI